MDLSGNKFFVLIFLILEFFLDLVILLLFSVVFRFKSPFVPKYFVKSLSIFSSMELYNSL